MNRAIYLNTELARPIGIVNGTKVGGTRRARTHTKALSDTLVTRADGSQYWIKRNTRSSSPKRTSRVTPVAVPHRTTAADLPALLAD